MGGGPVEFLEERFVGFLICVVRCRWYPLSWFTSPSFREIAGVGSNTCHLVFAGASELQNVVSLGSFLQRLWFNPVSLRVWETFMDGVTSSNVHAFRLMRP